MQDVRCNVTRVALQPPGTPGDPWCPAGAPDPGRDAVGQGHGHDGGQGGEALLEITKRNLTHDAAGFDHRVGHSLLLLYDAKAPHSQKSKEFKGLGHYPTNIPVRLFLYHNKIYYLYNYLIFLLFL